MRGFISDAETVLGSPGRNLLAVLCFVGTVAVVSTLAYMAAGWSFTDASYMVLITIYTVGFGEVRPIDTPYLHIVTVLTMMLGCTDMILLTGVLVQLFTIVQLREFLGGNRMQHRIDQLTDHIIICGFGRIGATLARDLGRAGVPLVILDRTDERLSEAEAAGHCLLAGDATEEELLIAAGIKRARCLATVLPDDAGNVFITLSARNLNPDIEIIARGEVPTTAQKLRRAGADHVVLPTHIGAERMARLILYPASDDLSGDESVAGAREQLGKLGLDLEKVLVSADAALCGTTVAEAERRAAGAVMIVQINRGQSQRMARPAPDEVLEAGDELLVVIRDAGEAARGLFSARTEVRSGRNRF